VLGNYCRLYLKANRPSATRFPYQQPIIGVDSSIAEDYLAEIELTKPRLIVRVVDAYFVPDSIEDYLREHYVVFYEHNHTMLSNNDIPVAFLVYRRVA
jgi:hypothetical protein